MPPDYYGDFLDRLKAFLEKEKIAAEEGLKTAFSFSLRQRTVDCVDITNKIDELLPQVKR
jgi:hypothetical protein